MMVTSSYHGGCIIYFRRFLCLSLLIFLLGCRSGAVSPVPAEVTSSTSLTVLDQRVYAIHQQVEIINDGPGRPEKQNIWVALIRDFPPYQEVQSMEISPKDYTPVTDEYGNRYAEFDFSQQPAGTTRTVTIDYRLTVNGLTYNLSACQGDLPDIFTRPELHIESANPQVLALSEKLSRGKETACQRVRAFYDYIGDTLTYTNNGKNWGAQAALGSMGSDCTEYSDLLVALSRAQGIPARYFEGLLYLDQRTDSLATQEHAWPDVYLPASGWVGLDPTLGRKQADRENYFANYTPDHIIVTVGTSPSVLRGSSYWSHLYWPGDSTKIRVSGSWKIERTGSN